MKKNRWIALSAAFVLVCSAGATSLAAEDCGARRDAEYWRPLRECIEIKRDSSCQLPWQKLDETPGQLPWQKPDQKPDETPDQTPDENPGETPDETPDQAPGADIEKLSYEQQVLALVNQERAKQGLSALSWSDELTAVARAHSKDMAARGFFSHTNPDGQSPFDRMKAAGISYRTAGENIAAGQRTPQEVVNAWMNSEGHRANILNASYTRLGVGYASGSGAYSTYWTQCFAG